MIISEFGHRIHACRFQQFGVLTGDSANPEQVRMIKPFEDQRLADSAGFGQLGTASRGRALLEQCFHGLDAGLGRRGLIRRANTFDILHVCHEIFVSLVVAIATLRG